MTLFSAGPVTIDSKDSRGIKLIPEIFDEQFLWWLGGVSAFMFVATLLVIPWLVIRIPADYFVDPHRHNPVVLSGRPILHAVWRIFANLLGVVLVFAGVAMLVLPGQGILTIVVGLLLMNFPGKYELERWLVSFRAVHRSINGIRRRAGRQPLVVPATDE
ncbi:MAG: PGPGW domain-containing protein [Xanthomonadales bacterium]|nr:PGPGW domain-containing protein [Xanthomonadales bacterium]